LGSTQAHPGAPELFTEERESELLLQELERIGKKEKSLDPLKLVKYKYLLNCPAVTRLAGPNATDSQRAKCARHAILDAVANINDTSEQRTAQIALCAVAPFIGKSVTERKALPTKGISTATFTRHREGALLYVVRYLQDDSCPTSSGTESSQPESVVVSDAPQDVARSFDALLLAASRLQYAVLSYLFVSSLNRRLERDSPVRQEAFEAQTYPNIAIAPRRELDERKRKLRPPLLYRVAVFDIRCHEFRDPYVTWMRRNMPNEQWHDLGFYLSTITMGVGVNANERQMLRDLAVGPDSPDATDKDYVRQINHVLQRWNPDHDKRVQAADKTVFFTRAEMLAAKTAALLKLATELPGFDREMLKTLDKATTQKHREAGRKQICEHYLYMPGKLAVDGIPLPAAIDNYFDVTGKRFATSPVSKVDWRSYEDEDLLPWSHVSLAG
jgi:hypothetical protein